MKPEPQNLKCLTNNLINGLTTLLFYLSILLFIIGLKFTDAPLIGNWYQQFMPNLNGRQITDITFIDSLNGYAVTNNLSPGDTGYILKTTNGGTNWNLQYTFPGYLADIYFFNKMIGVATSGAVFRTTNGGFNWTQSQSSETGGKMSFASDSIGWAGWFENKIAKTTTGGRLWFYQSTPIYNTGSVSSAETLKAWAGGSGLVHTTDGGGPPIGITQIGNEVPKDFVLFQNYPNPFNPNTVISYQLPKGRAVNSFVNLKVYDIMGKEIITLVNQKQNAGSYEVDFNGSNLSSGVYFYSLLIDNNVIDTKKMLLIK